jgi:hypothetical protein
VRRGPGVCPAGPRRSVRSGVVVDRPAQRGLGSLAVLLERGGEGGDRAVGVPGQLGEGQGAVAAVAAAEAGHVEAGDAGAAAAFGPVGAPRLEAFAGGRDEQRRPGLPFAGRVPGQAADAPLPQREDARGPRVGARAALAGVVARLAGVGERQGIRAVLDDTLERGGVRGLAALGVGGVQQGDVPGGVGLDLVDGELPVHHVAAAVLSAHVEPGGPPRRGVRAFRVAVDAGVQLLAVRGGEHHVPPRAVVLDPHPYDLQGALDGDARRGRGVRDGGALPDPVAGLAGVAVGGHGPGRTVGRRGGLRRPRREPERDGHARQGAE